MATRRCSTFDDTSVGLADQEGSFRGGSPGGHARACPWGIARFVASQAGKNLHYRPEE